MRDNEKMKFLDKIKDVYYYDNRNIPGFTDNYSEHCIAANYVTFKHRLKAYNLEDKIVKIIENISINEKEKDDENIITIEMKLRDRERIKKKNKC